MRRKDDRKLEAITRATFTLVESGGLPSVKMAEVAKVAQVAPSTLYIYFPSKAALLGDVFRRAKAATMAAALVDYDGSRPLRARARTVWFNLLRNRLKDPAQALFQEQFLNSPWYDGSSMETMSHLSATLTEALTQGKRDEIVRDVPNQLLMAIFFGSIRETARLVRSGEIRDSPDLLNVAFSMCWDGMKA